MVKDYDSPVGMLGRYLFCVVVVAFFDPWLALILALLWPPLLLSGYWFSRRLRVRFRTAREANSALTSRIQETLQGIKVIKAYGAEVVVCPVAVEPDDPQSYYSVAERPRVESALAEDGMTGRPMLAR
mgnify:CR=1 FL=1